MKKEDGKIYLELNGTNKVKVVAAMSTSRGRWPLMMDNQGNSIEIKDNGEVMHNATEEMKSSLEKANVVTVSKNGIHNGTMITPFAETGISPGRLWNNLSVVDRKVMILGTLPVSLAEHLDPLDVLNVLHTLQYHIKILQDYLTKKIFPSFLHQI